MLETLKEWWVVLEPALPYMAIMFVVDQVMRRFVKPGIASKRNSDWEFKSKFWYRIRRGMLFYPMAMAALLGWGFLVSGVTVNLMWCVIAGAAAQLLVHLARDEAKSRGYSLPEGS